MDVRELYVQRGDAILPAWNKLLNWAKQFRVFAGRGIRLTRTPNGTYIVADLQASTWDHPFRVSLGGKELTIGMGTLNNRIPTINGLPLDGAQAGKAQAVPKLKLTSGPNAELRSWVCLQLRVDRQSGEISADDENAVSIVHKSDIENGLPSDGSIGLHALAMLVWNSDRSSVKRLHQVTHFHLQHRWLKGTDPQPARHLFWPA
jgi:hypothetical protein